MKQIDGLLAKKIVKEKNTKKKASGGREFILYKTYLLIIILGFISLYFFMMDFSPIKNNFEIINLLRNGKFLILLQNNSELRPAGGFLGSYALVEMKNGRIDNFSIDANIYKMDDKFGYIRQIKAPEPLQSFIKERFWTMHDANWSADFGQAARDVMWFYQEESNNLVDGVIAVNASVVQDLLSIIGPVELDQYSIKLNQNNFFDVLHTQIEKEYYKNEDNKEFNEPKAILKDLYNVILDRVREKKYRQDLYSLIKNELREKQILFYFNNLYWQKTISWLNWGGLIRETKNDYLYISNANLGGLKSSLDVNQEITLNVIKDEGSIVNELTINRTHRGSGQWPHEENRNYMKIFVPKDSELVSVFLDEENISYKINISREFNKTVFGFWFSTLPQSSKKLIISYKLPQSISRSKQYQLTWQKQPGVIYDDLIVNLNNQKIFGELIRTDQIIK